MASKTGIPLFQPSHCHSYQPAFKRAISVGTRRDCGLPLSAVRLHRLYASWYQICFSPPKFQTRKRENSSFNLTRGECPLTVQNMFQTRERENSSFNYPAIRRYGANVPRVSNPKTGIPLFQPSTNGPTLTSIGSFKPENGHIPLSTRVRDRHHLGRASVSNPKTGKSLFQRSILPSSARPQ